MGGEWVMARVAANWVAWAENAGCPRSSSRAPAYLQVQAALPPQPVGMPRLKELWNGPGANYRTHNLLPRLRVGGHHQRVVTVWHRHPAEDMLPPGCSGACWLNMLMLGKQLGEQGSSSPSAAAAPPQVARSPRGCTCCWQAAPDGEAPR